MFVFDIICNRTIRNRLRSWTFFPFRFSFNGRLSNAQCVALLCLFLFIVNGSFHSYSNVFKRRRTAPSHQISFLCTYVFHISVAAVAYNVYGFLFRIGWFVRSFVFMCARGIFVFIFVALPILLLFGFFVSGRETLVICDVRIQHAETKRSSFYEFVQTNFLKNFDRKVKKRWTKWKT